jgi:fumarate reductase flavoprotein subunit
MKRIVAIAAAAMLLAAGMGGCLSGAQGRVKPGKYEASSQGISSMVKVEVTVDAKGRIAEVAVDAAGETNGIGQVAAPQVAKAIVESQSLKVDAVSGATKTSSAILAAAGKALAAAGFDVGTLEGRKAAQAVDEEVTVDVGIVGAGAAGTMAAAAASETGAKVLIVERTNGIGGVSKAWAGGPFAVESSLQKKAGYDIKKEAVLQRVLDYSHYIAYAPLAKAIIYKSGSTIDWLGGYGVYFHANPESPQLAHRDDPMKWQLYCWYDQFGKDVAALDIVHAKLKERGVALRLQTTATDLIQDKDGAVTGFIASKADGGKLTVHAKSVVLATGGFANNKAMMAENFHTEKITGFGENYGDGARMAWKAGAARWDLQSSLLHGSGIVAGSKPGKVALSMSPFNQITRSPLMWVDLSGNRFCNEDAVYDTAYTANVGYSVGGSYYILVDRATLDDYTKGSRITMDPAVGGPNMAKADFIALAEDGVEQGCIAKGASLAELARQTGMDPARLEANVKEYNEAVAAKRDPYGKQAASLIYPVVEGPFYAVKMQISTLGTLGGVRVNERLEATDASLRPIPGLYVAGGDAGGFYGNTTTYPPYEGLATGFALNSGRIAGESAAERARGK